MKAKNQGNQFINPWVKEDEQFIIDNHGKLTYKEMSKILNRTPSAIQNKARRLGLERISKYNYNKNFFEIIDTEEKAYWLGFIYADGYVNKSEYGGELGIELQYSDNNHLKKFNKSIDGNVEVNDRYRNGGFNYNKDKQFHMCNIRLYCTKIVDDLSKYGIVNNKTYIKQHMSTLIPNNLIQHFIRGFFDGDGSISITKQGRNFIQFDITNANNIILEDIRQYLYQNYNITSYISCEENRKYSTVPIYKLCFKGLYNAYNFGQYIYNNANIYLDRKYLLYQRYLKEYNIVERISNKSDKILIHEYQRKLNN